MGSGFRRPNSDKFKAIHEMQRPVTQKQLRSVLGLFGYIGYCLVFELEPMYATSDGQTDDGRA